MNNGPDKPVTQTELKQALLEQEERLENRLLHAVERMITDAEARMVEVSREMQAEILRAFGRQTAAHRN